MTGNETEESAEPNQQQDELRKQVVQPAIDSTASSGSNLKMFLTTKEEDNFAKE